MTDNTNDQVRVLREALAALVNLDQRCGWHSKEQDNAIRVLAAIPHREQRETVAAGECVGEVRLAPQLGWHVHVFKAWDQIGQGTKLYLAPVAAPVPEAKAEQVGDTSRNWPEDFSQENGNYQNKCNKCDSLFMGNKHRRACKNCAAPAVKHEASELPPLPVDAHWSNNIGVCYTDDQMRAYGQACHALGRGAAVREYVDTGTFKAPPIAVQGSIGDDPTFDTLLSRYVQGVQRMDSSKPRRALVEYIVSRLPSIAVQGGHPISGLKFKPCDGGGYTVTLDDSRSPVAAAPNKVDVAVYLAREIKPWLHCDQRIGQWTPMEKDRAESEMEHMKLKGNGGHCIIYEFRPMIDAANFVSTIKPEDGYCDALSKAICALSAAAPSADAKANGNG